MNVRMDAAWKSMLEPLFHTQAFRDLTVFVRHAYKSEVCYPPASKIFAAFDACPLHKLKVVILGQDPYHGPGQANGLCFSVADGQPHPPSLGNIFKEIESQTGKPYPKSGDLSPWASQGVLLLNAILTVKAHQAGSHQNKGWETFTDAVIQQLSNQKEGIVFLLWGGYAKKKTTLIDPNKHHILTSGHPSPLSANRGYWFGNDHFNKCNAWLAQQGKTPVVW